MAYNARYPRTCTLTAVLLLACGTAPPPTVLPQPVTDPLAIRGDDDPVLAIVRSASSPEDFRSAIRAAVRRAPGLGEAVAQREESEAARNEARARQYPTADLALSHFEVVSRAFSNDPQNILERQRPQFRTDGTLRIQQPLIDFGASANRIAAGNARLAAAAANIEDAGARVALQAVAAWYNVFGYRTLVRLTEAYALDQADLRGAMELRIRQGASARGDMAQVDSAIASARAQLADFRRSLASAEAQYQQAVGQPAPEPLARAPAPDLSRVSAATLADQVETLPTVRAAQAIAKAADRDARAVSADALPAVTLGVDAGRYGILQNRKDYDIRASVSLNWRIGGGAVQRIDQAEARAHAAAARLIRTRDEATRDATIALADVKALADAEVALADNYLASRQARDVLVERFRVSRGTLYDVLTAQNSYFGVAARYIQTVTELDTARYVLLARTGTLLDTLAIGRADLDP